MGLAFIAFFSGVINSYFAAHAAQGFAFDLRQASSVKYSRSPWRPFAVSDVRTHTRLTSDVTMAQNVLLCH